MNLNKLAVDIAKREGGKKSISIAQIKEVLRIAFQELGKHKDKEVIHVVNRYRK